MPALRHHFKADDMLQDRVGLQGLMGPGRRCPAALSIREGPPCHCEGGFARQVQAGIMCALTAVQTLVAGILKHPTEEPNCTRKLGIG